MRAGFRLCLICLPFLVSEWRKFYFEAAYCTGGLPMKIRPLNRCVERTLRSPAADKPSRIMRPFSQQRPDAGRWKREFSLKNFVFFCCRILRNDHETWRATALQFALWINQLPQPAIVWIPIKSVPSALIVTKLYQMSTYQIKNSLTSIVSGDFSLCKDVLSYDACLIRFNFLHRTVLIIASAGIG